MLIDTHCHINDIIKKTFDTPLSIDDCKKAQKIIYEAQHHDVNIIINVGTSVIESHNSIMLATMYPSIYASVGIHPNDCSDAWRTDFAYIQKMAREKEQHKIVAIGECGLDYHYPPYNEQRQKDAFKAQIELALQHNLALVIHTRDAHDEVLRILDTYRSPSLRGTIHCFSENITFAQHAIDLGFVLGIGGTITYPKNNHLRDTVISIGLEHCVLETDAPFLPPQSIRGKENHPLHTQTVAHYLASLCHTSYDNVARITTTNVERIFGIASKDLVHE